MSENCTHDCSSCGEECPSRQNPESFLAPMNKMSNVKKVIGVVSGKGGVGKSLVTSMLAVTMQRRGFKTAILDADITGPSIPKCFGIHEKAMGSDDGLFPVNTKTGIETMSINELLPDETSPVVWRGPILAGAVTQFWTDVAWGELDVLLIDMPPGTGDVPLTVYQSLAVDGTIVVSTPQSLVQMVVGKAKKMADMLSIPVLGMVENMSYAVCPDCGRRIELFGTPEGLEQAAAEMGVPLLTRLPMNPDVARLCDEGEIERVVCEEMEPAADAVERLLKE